MSVFLFDSHPLKSYIINL